MHEWANKDLGLVFITIDGTWLLGTGITLEFDETLVP
jgi:hypothetical protein